jgi:non-ribosomal peptide synthetase component E (peptide arylation enzyme)
MTLGDALEHGTRRNPERAALICGENALSYSELDHRASRLAHWF